MTCGWRGPSPMPVLCQRQWQLWGALGNHSATAELGTLFLTRTCNVWGPTRLGPDGLRKRPAMSGINCHLPRTLSSHLTVLVKARANQLPSCGTGSGCSPWPLPCQERRVFEVNLSDLNPAHSGLRVCVSGYSNSFHSEALHSRCPVPTIPILSFRGHHLKAHTCRGRRRRQAPQGSPTAHKAWHAEHSFDSR